MECFHTTSLKKCYTPHLSVLIQGTECFWLNWLGDNFFASPLLGWCQNFIRNPEKCYLYQKLLWKKIKCFMQQGWSSFTPSIQFWLRIQSALDLTGYLIYCKHVFCWGPANFVKVYKSKLSKLGYSFEKYRVWRMNLCWKKVVSSAVNIILFTVQTIAVGSSPRRLW